MNPYDREAQFVLWLAFERGRTQSTFATFDEHTTPGYSEAWERGYKAQLVADAAEAEETFGADALEEYAREHGPNRKQTT